MVLRPGIKRGNFTPHEEGMIIHLQALLGNKWAAIASYLPQRTDNDIKNYWNTHLKKKLKKFQASGMDPHMASSDSTTNNNTTSHQYLSNKSFNDRRSSNLDISINNNNNNNGSVSSSSTTYASSTENISRLLEGWMRASPKSQQLKGTQNQLEIQGFEEQSKLVKSVSLPALNLQLQNRTKLDNNDDEKEFDSILSFENLNSAAWDKSTCDSMPENEKSDQKGHHDHDHNHDGAEKNYRQKSENSNSNNGAPPLSFLEKWLLDENVGHGEEMMELSSPMF